MVTFDMRAADRAHRILRLVDGRILNGEQDQARPERNPFAEEMSV
jgi:hypothetical protein